MPVWTLTMGTPFPTLLDAEIGEIWSKPCATPAPPIF